MQWNVFPRGSVSCNHSLASFFLLLDYSLDDYKRCTQAGLKVGANIKGIYVALGIQGGSCDALLNEFGGEVTRFAERPAEYVPLDVRTPMPWSHLVSPQRTQSMAAWWRTLCPSSGAGAVRPSLRWCLKSFPPRSWWGSGARAYVITLTSYAKQWVPPSFPFNMQYWNLTQKHLQEWFIVGTGGVGTVTNTTYTNRLKVRPLCCFSVGLLLTLQRTGWRRFLFRFGRCLSWWSPETSPIPKSWKGTWGERCQSTWPRPVPADVLRAATTEWPFWKVRKQVLLFMTKRIEFFYLFSYGLKVFTAFIHS